METILCSAVWWKDFIPNNDFCYDIPLQNMLPINLDKGIVTCGFRHNHCIYSMCYITGEVQYTLGESIQGFLTSKNRFVTREEGAIIHTNNGGILKFSKTKLYSEDLF